MEVDGAEPGLRYAVLGPLRAWRDAQELDLGPAKQRAVLAVLLINANSAVPAHQIVDAVWEDDPPENGANVVQKYIAGLRRIVEPDRSPRSPSRVITLDDAGYRLQVSEAGLDSLVFDASVRRARVIRPGGGDPESTAGELRQALALWRSQPLAGLSGRYFDAARRRLAESRAAAWEVLAEIELKLGHHAQLTLELRPLIEEFPAREGLRNQLILALYRSGRQAEALAAYREAQAYLSEEFGVDPGERLQDLHRRILNSDPSLGPAPQAVPPDRAGPAAAVQPPRSPAPPAEPPARAPAPRSPAPPTPAPGTASAPTGVRPAGLYSGDQPYPPMFFGPPIGSVLPPQAPTKFPWLRAIFWTSVPVLTCGLGTWLVIGYLGIRRRSVVTCLCGVGYAILISLFIVAIAVSDLDDPNPPWTVWDTFGMTGFFICPTFGAAHALTLVVLDSYRHQTHALTEATENIRRMNRERSLQIVVHSPRIAEELRIGRPDLPRWFDDGGLIDVNAVPEALLGGVPGLTIPQAHAIIEDRRFRGPFTSVEDLIARHPYLRQADRALHQMVIIGSPVQGSHPAVPDRSPDQLSYGPQVHG